MDVAPQGPARGLPPRFEIRRVIGEGGMAVVSLVWDNDVQHWRALKVLKRTLGERASLVRRFEREGVTMMSIDHPNVVRVYDLVSWDENVHLVMEYVEGGSVVNWLERHGPMSPRLAVKVALMVCAGLGAAHARGIVHRDIKPQNLLIDRYGMVKITDFGVAQARADVGLTKTGAVMGTMGYMAPEQQNDSSNVDVRADVFSVGATLYDMLTARAPHHLYMNDVDWGGIPDPLQRVIQRACAYRRDDRYRDLNALIEALRIARRSLPTEPPKQPPLFWEEYPLLDEAPIPRPVSRVISFNSETDNASAHGAPPRVTPPPQRPSLPSHPRPTPVPQPSRTAEPGLRRSQWGPAAEPVRYDAGSTTARPTPSPLRRASYASEDGRTGRHTVRPLDRYRTRTEPGAAPRTPTPRTGSGTAASVSSLPSGGYSLPPRDTLISVSPLRPRVIRRMEVLRHSAIRVAANVAMLCGVFLFCFLGLTAYEQQRLENLEDRIEQAEANRARTMGDHHRFLRGVLVPVRSAAPAEIDRLLYLMERAGLAGSTVPRGERDAEVMEAVASLQAVEQSLSSTSSVAALRSVQSAQKDVSQSMSDYLRELDACRTEQGRLLARAAAYVPLFSGTCDETDL